MAWLNELRRILTNQQKMLRGLRDNPVNTGQRIKVQRSTKKLQRLEMLLRAPEGELVEYLKLVCGGLCFDFLYRLQTLQKVDSKTVFIVPGRKSVYSCYMVEYKSEAILEISKMVM